MSWSPRLIAFASSILLMACVASPVAASRSDGPTFQVATGPAGSGALATIPFTQYCSQPYTQICKPSIPAGTFDATAEDLYATYTASSGHCSDLRLLIYKDDSDTPLAASPWTSPSGSVGFRIPWPHKGPSHALSFAGEGRTGGCNHGALGSWAGTLELRAASTRYIAGTVTTSNCTADGCGSPGPLVDATVTARGPKGTGSATTDTDGHYEIELPKGSYTIKPSLEALRFEPSSRSVTLGAAAVKGQDFRTCGVAAASAAGVAPAVTACDLGLAMDWHMPERLTETTPVDHNWASNQGMPSTAEVYPASWKADVFLTQSGSRYNCPAGVRFTWSVDPLDGGRSLKVPVPGCATTMTVSRLGRYLVTATRQEFKSGGWKNDPNVKAVKHTVLIKDWLIVGVGDSNASGEGNPSTFYYLRCNRGTASYQFQSALYVENQDPHTSVTFIHTGCSGARIEHLVGTPYKGTRQAKPPLPPQIEDVSFLLSNNAKPAPREVDAAIVSAGINDLAFGAIMHYCVFHGTQVSVKPCEEHFVVPVLDEAKRIVDFESDVQLGRPVRAWISELQKKLLPKYEPLAHTLKKPIAVKGGLSLSADRVFISRLPDFSFGPDGNYCDTREPALYNLPHWGPSTWAWLSLQGSLFAHTVRAAASTYGWHYIGYNEKAFSKRGFCNLTNSLFAGLWGTVSQFDIAGGFHPIAEAHLLARDMLVPVLCKRLYKTADCTGAPR